MVFNNLKFTLKHSTSTHSLGHIGPVTGTLYCALLSLIILCA